MGWYGGSGGGGALSDPPYTIEGNPTSATANTAAFTIGSLTAKTVPASTDQLMLQDNAASGALKSVPWSSMPGAGGGMSIGGAVTGGTANSILYVGSGPVLAQDNANLCYDTTNHNLFLGGGSSITGGTNNSLVGAWSGPASTLSSVVALSDGAGNLRLDYNYTYANEWTVAKPLVVAAAAQAFYVYFSDDGAGNWSRANYDFTTNAGVLTMGTTTGGSPATSPSGLQWVFQNQVRMDYSVTTSGQWTWVGVANFSNIAAFKNVGGIQMTVANAPIYQNNSGPTYFTAIQSTQNTGVASAVGIGRSSTIGGAITNMFFAIVDTGVFGLGGMTSSFPGIVNSGATLKAVLADNSGDANLTAKGLTLSGEADLAAGTTSIVPLKFQSGTSLATPAVGACEFDGTAFYKTAVASARQVVDTEQVIVQSASRTFTNNTSAQAIFNATTNGAVTLAATTTYEFEMMVAASGFSSSAHTINIGFGGTAAFTSIAYYYESQTGSTLAGPNADSSGFVATATATAVVASSTTTGLLLYVRGTMRVNTGGTVIPQLTQVTASAAAVVQTNSFFRCWPIGNNTITNVGNWS